MPLQRDRVKEFLSPALDRLREVTVECREDMHEPDNVDVSAVVFLNNAMGNFPSGNCGELTIGIKQGDGNYEWFNLATLIALARKAEL